MHRSPAPLPASPMSGLQVGGALRAGAPYVRRPADRLLVEALRAGELCYVLAPRQIGKSSLRVRAAAELRAAGLRVVSIDLSGFGAAGLDPESWFYGLAVEIAQGLGLPDPSPAWEAAAGRPPAARWSATLERAVVRGEGPPAVVLLDEIDAVLALPFGGEDLFAAIRAAADRRAEDPAWERLRFCLMGVASPADLIRDPRRTPFNVGRAVRLEDFTAPEAEALLPALEGLGAEPRALLGEVLRWSAGHPFQTAQLCAALAERPLQEDEPVGRRVEAIVRRLYLGPWPDPGLEAAGRALRDPEHPELLGVYRRALGAEGLPWDARSTAQARLALSGLVAVRGPRLRVRNEIVRTVYNQEWISTVQGRRALRERAWSWVDAGRPEHLLLDARALETLRAQGGAELEREEEAYLLRSEARVSEVRGRARVRRLTGAALALALLLLAAALVAWGERRDSERQALAQRASNLPSAAAIPGRQDQALYGALEALEALRDTPFGALAARGLAETLETVRGRPLGRGAAWGLAWLGERALIVGRKDGKLDLLSTTHGPDRGVELGSGLSAIGVSPDGSRALLGTADGAVRWWDLRAFAALGEPVVAHLPGPARSCLDRWVQDEVPGVRVARVSASGQGLTVGAEGGVRLWDPEGGSRALEPHDALDAQFSPDGQRVAVATARGLLLFFDARTGLLLETRGPWPGVESGPEECEGQREHPGALLALASSPSGDLAAVGRRGVTVLTRWEPDAGSRALDAPGLAPWAVALSPDGLTLATATEDGAIRVWDTRTGALRARHVEPRQGALGLAFSPDGRWLAATGHDDRVFLWDVRGGDLLWQAAVMPGGGVSLAFSPDSQHLAAAGGGGLRLFDAGPSVSLDRWSLPGRGRPSSLSVSPQEELLLTWTEGPPALLLPGGGHGDPPSPEERADAALFSPAGDRVLWSGERGARISTGGQPPGALLAGRTTYWLDPWTRDGQRVALWDRGQGRVSTATGAPSVTLEGTLRPELALSPDGARILGVSPEGELLLFDAGTGARLATLCALGQEARYPLAWAPDGRRFAAGGDDSVCLGDREHGQATTLPLSGDARQLAWTGERLWVLDNGDTLVGLGPDGEVQVEVDAHASQARQLYASPDGQRLASAASDGDLLLGSADGEVLARWQVHLGVARHLRFSPDGQSVYSAGDDGAIVRLPGSVEALVWMACDWLSPGAPRPASCAG